MEAAELARRIALQAAGDLVVIDPEFAVQDSFLFVRLQDQFFIFRSHGNIISDFAFIAKLFGQKNSPAPRGQGDEF